MLSGTLVRWFPDRGFGFLSRTDRRDDDIFVHAVQFEAAGIVAPEVGQKFQFLVEIDPKRGNRRRAVDIRPIEASAGAAAASAAEDAGGY